MNDTQPPEREVVAAYKRGDSMRRIADRYAVSDPAVRRVLVRHNVPIRTTRQPKLSPGQVKEVRRKYGEGVSSGALAEEYGVSGHAILRALEDMERHPAGVFHRSDLPVQQVVDRYQAGESISALAAAYETSWETVSRLLKRAGVSVRVAPKTGRLPVEEVVKAYQDGATIRALGERYGVSRDAVRTFLIKQGVQMRAKGSPPVWSEEQREEARSLYRQGMSKADIARHFGIGREPVARLLRQEPSPATSHHGLTDEQVKEAVRLYREGMAGPAIAERLGVRVYAVRQVVGPELRRSGDE